MLVSILRISTKASIISTLTLTAISERSIAEAIAIPMLAGPGSISLLIAFYQEHNTTIEIIISVVAIIAISAIIFIVLRSAHYLAKILGASGIVAISRIVGFIVIAIGIQYIVSAIVNIIKGNLT